MAVPSSLYPLRQAAPIRTNANMDFILISVTSLGGLDTPPGGAMQVPCARALEGTQAGRGDGGGMLAPATLAAPWSLPS